MGGYYASCVFSGWASFCVRVFHQYRTVRWLYYQGKMKSYRQHINKMRGWKTTGFRIHGPVPLSRASNTTPSFGAGSFKGLQNLSDSGCVWDALIPGTAPSGWHFLSLYFMHLGYPTQPFLCLVLPASLWASFQRYHCHLLKEPPLDNLSPTASAYTSTPDAPQICTSSSDFSLEFWIIFWLPF